MKQVRELGPSPLPLSPLAQGEGNKLALLLVVALAGSDDPAAAARAFLQPLRTALDA